MSEAEGFEPKLVGFLCNWCSYAGADLAGVSRFQYPPNLRVIRVMCSGRVDPAFVLRAFQRGLDGVMVLGCHPGDCHYATGNYYAQNRVRMLRQLLRLVGLSPDRLFLDWVSAGEGQRFAELVSQFTEQVRSLGPLGQAAGEPAATKPAAQERAAGQPAASHLEKDAGSLQQRLEAARRVVESEKVRWLVGRQRELLNKGNVYGTAVAPETLEALIAATVADEYLRNRLLLLASDQALSVRDMAAGVGMAPRQLLPHIVALEQSGALAMVGVRGKAPTYRRL